MKTILSTGKQIQLGVHHVDDAVWTRIDGTKVENLRGTTIRFTYTNSDGSVIFNTSGKVICIPPDQFCKRTGRRIAGIKLLKNLNTYGFSKMERKEVFQLICPEYC